METDESAFAFRRAETCKLHGKETRKALTDTAHASAQCAFSQRGIEAIIGEECRHGGEYAPVFLHPHVTPRESDDARFLHGEKVIVIFQFAGETGIPSLGSDGANRIDNTRLRHQADSRRSYGARQSNTACKVGRTHSSASLLLANRVPTRRGRP